MGRISRDGGFGNAKKIIIIVLVLLIIIGVLLGLAYARGNSDKILKGVYVNGVDIGDMTEDEAREVISDYKNALEKKAIILHYDGSKSSFYGEDVGIKISSRVIDEALKYGRDDNPISQIGMVISSFFGKKIDISENVKIDEDSLKEKIDSLVSSTGSTAVDATYEIVDDEIKIVKGHDGITPKYDDVIQEIIEQASSQDGEVDVEVTADIERSVDVDIEDLYNRVHVEKRDAEYTTGGKYVQEKVGISFDQNDAYQKYRNLAPDGTMTIKLIKENPEITTENLAKILFADVLGTCKTDYAVSNTNRTTNLQIAARNINEKIFLPDEVFSYNKEVGERTVARGFKEAHVYSGGEVVDGLGGGICQISSTLYNAVLQADLEVVERKNHMFWPQYVKPSLDATVAWGSIDFQFKNNRKTPIKIEASVKNGVATVTIYGKKEENEPKINIEWKVLQEYAPTTIERKDESMPIGKTEVVQNPVKGYKSEAYKVYVDPTTGKEIKREKISTDIYKATDKIVKVGAKEVATPVPQPTQPPTPAPVAPEPQTYSPLVPFTLAPPVRLTTEPPRNGWPTGWDTPENPNYRG